MFYLYKVNFNNPLLLSFKNLAGCPIYMLHSGISLLTNVIVPVALPSPIVIPGKITLWAPTCEYFFNITFP